MVPYTGQEYALYMIRLTTRGILLLPLAILVAVGCGAKTNEPQTKEIVGLDKLSPEEQIKKIQSNSSIPDQYKQSLVNSIESKGIAEDKR